MTRLIPKSGSGALRQNDAIAMSMTRFMTRFAPAVRFSWWMYRLICSIIAAPFCSDHQHQEEG